MRVDHLIVIKKHNFLSTSLIQLKFCKRVYFFVFFIIINWAIKQRKLNMDSKTKTITLLLTGISLLGITSLLVVMNGTNAKGLTAIASGLNANSERTITINKNNRLIGFKYDNNTSTSNTSPLFPMSEGLAYGIIQTSQNQQAIIENDNDVVLVLWNNQLSEFTINPTYYDDETITRNDVEYTIAKFNHLTQIDLKLDKGNGTDRVLSLKSEVNGDEEGIFTKIADEASYVQWSWKRDNADGYLTTTDKLEFSTSMDNNGKAIWLTEIVFHYSC